jgi:myosin heavy subunit
MCIDLQFWLTDLHAQQVIEQLRCAGVIEAIRISRAAYPNRMLHQDCVRYSDTATAVSTTIITVTVLQP